VVRLLSGKYLFFFLSVAAGGCGRLGFEAEARSSIQSTHIPETIRNEVVVPEQCSGPFQRLLALNTQQIDSALTDFPVLVLIPQAWSAGGKMLADGENLRFVADDGKTTLEHEVEAWNHNGKAFVWVKVPHVKAAPAVTAIWMLYGGEPAVSKPDARQVWSNAYRGVWHMNSLAPLYDATLHGNDGVQDVDVSADNAPETPLGPSLDFNGRTSSVTVLDNDSLDIKDALTISVWARAESAGEVDRAFLYKFEAYKAEPSRAWAGGDRPTFYFWPQDYSGSTEFRRVAAATPLQTGEWNHHAFTYDISARKMAIYLNGELEAENDLSTDTALTDPHIRASTWNVRIGAGGGSAAGKFDGQIGELQLSASKRPAAWIRAEYLMGSGQFIQYGEEERCP